MRAVKEDIRTSCWQELLGRLDEEEAREALQITDNNMRMAYGQNSVQAHGYKAGSGSQTAKLKSLAGYNHICNEEAEEKLTTRCAPRKAVFALSSRSTRRPRTTG
jgi:hypothetical protein